MIAALFMAAAAGAMSQAFYDDPSFSRAALTLIFTALTVYHYREASA